MSAAKARYRQFCAENYLPLAHRDWWLDAVCGPGVWDVALAFDKRGDISGALPWQWARRWGLFSELRTPILSAYAGVWHRWPQPLDTMPPERRYAFEKNVAAQIVAALPKHRVFNQCFRPETTNWLPFYWLGFRQTTRYTYVLDFPADVLGNLRKYDALRKIEKAQRLVEVSESEDVEAFCHLHEKSLRRRGIAPGPTLAALRRLDVELKSRGQRAIFLARDRQTGRLCAGQYIAWDERQAVNLAGGFDPDLADRQATWLVLLQSVLFAEKKAQQFDFEGSMDAGLERVYRAFDGRQLPYSRIWKINGAF